MILCCHCAVPIAPNAINMCVNCLQSRHDIGAGVAKQVQQNCCRGCNRFERRDGGFALVEPESKELLALLLKKPRGLAAVRLADASFVWTEPHSKRIKLKITIQKEVLAGANAASPHTLEAVDITDAEHAQWWDRYKYDIPVLHVNQAYWAKHRRAAQPLAPRRPSAFDAAPRATGSRSRTRWRRSPRPRRAASRRGEGSRTRRAWNGGRPSEFVGTCE